jgi:ribosomal protein S18 acetylase RimI-like enzyme
VTSESADIQPRHDLTAQQIHALEDRLYAFNAARTGHHDAAPLAFTAEVRGELVGAAAGFTWGGVCELQQVWVDETHRGRGLGRDLVRRAIQEARDRGCASVFLSTYDFQAPRFYARLGFEVVAQIHDKPLGYTDIVMRLALGQDPRAEDPAVTSGPAGPPDPGTRRGWPGPPGGWPCP